ncbi:MAG: hydroxyisourate hydrolase [Phycisphaerae bacterium]|nr:hydroxyisourate hydrolase [Phycisphaerae bacterium]
MPGKLSTHVLDTASGKPAQGMRIELHRIDRGDKNPLADLITNSDGRTDSPLLAGEKFTVGRYRILFHVGDYFASIGVADAKKFLDVVPVLFHIKDASANYHVPLLVSPWAYSTYRGS